MAVPFVWRSRPTHGSDRPMQSPVLRIADYSTGSSGNTPDACSVRWWFAATFLGLTPRIVCSYYLGDVTSFNPKKGSHRVSPRALVDVDQWLTAALEVVFFEKEKPPRFRRASKPFLYAASGHFMVCSGALGVVNTDILGVLLL